MFPRSRTSLLLCGLFLVASAGCDRLPGLPFASGPDDAGPGDVPMGPPTSVEMGEPAGPPTDSGISVALAGGVDSAVVDVVADGDVVLQTQDTTLAARLERILANQAALNRRLDAVAASVAATAPAPAGQAEGGAEAAAASDVSGAEGSEEDRVGAAREVFRNFGVRLVLSIVVIAFFMALVRGIVWLLDTLAERNARRRLFYKKLVPIMRIVLWVFAAYFIIHVIFQVDAQGIIAAAAAVGVAVGFAAQDLLKNLFGGVILVFDQPFQAGDKVEIGGTYGEVVSIGLRSTRIVTADDNLVSVPNAQVVDQQVSNANAGELNCQVVTDLYLPGWADEVAARRIAFDAAASSRFVYLNKPIVVLVSDVFKETFLTRIRVKAYVLDPRHEFAFQSDITERAREGFREEGLLRPAHMRQDLVWRSAVGVAGGGDDD